MMNPQAGKSRAYDQFSNAQLNLPFKDRNAINEEIHGVSCMAPNETPELLASALYELNRQLDQIEDKPAYNEAQKMYLQNSGVGGQYGYVNTDEFRLRFLRSELFDAKKAAMRLVKYLDLVYKQYGPYALKRPFKLSDLSKEDMSFLRGGDYQLMPYRDRSGRRVLCIVTNNRDDVSPTTRMRILLYLWLVSTEDVESQRKGLVVISISGPNITREEGDQNSKQQKFHENRVKTHATIGSAVPMRVAAIHFCLPNTTIHLILTRIYGMALGNFSARVKFHLGQSVELRYQLKSYGIPTELIPSTDTGNVKYGNLKQWIKMRAFLEQNPSSSSMHNISSDSDADAMDYEYTGSSIVRMPNFSNQYQQHQQQRNVIVECPGSNDVIFRRGKSMTYHPGNAMFQSLIESRLEEHDKANQAGKLSIVLQLIQTIQNEKGGRFLTWDAKNNWWLDMMAIPMTGAHHSVGGFFEAQELEIQSKVNYAFRDFKKKMKTQKALQVSKSSTYAFERQDGSQMKRRRGNKSKLDGCFCSDSDNSDSNN